MTNSHDRQRAQNKRVLRQLHDSAVHQATTRGITSIGAVTSISSVTDSETRADEDGNTIEKMLWGVDKWGLSEWS